MDSGERSLFSSPVPLPACNTPELRDDNIIRSHDSDEVYNKLEAQIITIGTVSPGFQNGVDLLRDHVDSSCPPYPFHHTYMGSSHFVLPRLGTDMGAGACDTDTLGNMDLRGSLPFTPFTPSWTPDPYGGYPLQFVNPFTHTPPVPSNPCSPIGYSYPLAPLPTSAPVYDMYPPPQEFGPIDVSEPLYPYHLGTTGAAVDYKTYGAQTVQHDPGFAHNYDYSDQDLAPDLHAQTMDSDLSSGMSLDFIKCETLLKQTRRSWLEDLLGAVLGYGLFSLGVMMLFLGLLYLYDADLQYKTLLVKETFHAELGCDYTLSSRNSKETMSFCHHNNTSVPDLHVYRTTAQPYLQILTALVGYTVLILGVNPKEEGGFKG
ncbi:hypothetical protein LENED_009773 [Lentinula edodes]|uniref:Uncharacterized protein n=1 Tax=Lentinula edodes TaxID=5353 RepID=A0A1Q3EKP7_LENED|nr:hypothetical protein LENED_009773 [Lentinula edodes]